MELEEFSLGDSWVHNLDPRVKIVVTLLFSLVAAVNQHVCGTALSLVLPVTLLVCAGTSIRKVLVRLGIVNGFIVFIWFFLPFTTPGETVCSIGPLSIQTEGVRDAFLIALKSNSIILMVIVLLGTSQIFNSGPRFEPPVGA